MAHVTNCPSCRAEVQVPETLFGQRVKCPTCGGIFTAPTSVAVQQTYSPAQTESPRVPPPPPHQELPGFRCPFCKTTRKPQVREQISLAGWIVFAVLMFACLPLFWIGLLMKENVHYCGDCGMKLGGGTI
jgi:transposase-like protein